MGQDLREASKEINGTLGRIKVRCHQKDSLLMEKCEAKLDLLREELMHKGYLRPRLYFNVTKSTYLQIHGTILTYLIVLLQFRVSE